MDTQDKQQVEEATSMEVLLERLLENHSGFVKSIDRIRNFVERVSGQGPNNPPTVEEPEVLDNRIAVLDDVITKQSHLVQALSEATDALEKIG